MVAELPTCLSLITCDEVAYDPLSGKPSLLGVIHELTSPVFPVHSSRVVVWAELTGIRGLLPIDFTALIQDPDNGLLVPVAAVRVPVVFPDSLGIVITGAYLEALPLIAPGLLVVRLAVDEAAIIERTIRVVRLSR